MIAMTKVSKSPAILTELRRLLSLDPYAVDFNEVADKVLQSNRNERKSLLELCDRSFGNADLRREESTRVACAKIMIALVPDSAESITRWITTTSGKDIYEVHFSLFCFLDQVPDLPQGKEFATRVPSLVERYLMEIKSNTAYAAFMAGDLLGDHWDANESLPVLLRLAKEAPYAAARDAALGGLGHVLRKLPKSDRRRDSIISLSRQVVSNDRSASVRLAANWLLEGRAR